MSEADIERVITALEERRIRSMLDVDIEDLADLTSDRYIHIESNGRRRDKTEFLHGLRDGEFRFEKFVIKNNLIIVRDRLAYIVGVYSNIIRTNEFLCPEKYARHIRIYEFEGDVWRNVFHQATEVSDYRERQV